MFSNLLEFLSTGIKNPEASRDKWIVKLAMFWNVEQFSDKYFMIGTNKLMKLARTYGLARNVF